MSSFKQCMEFADVVGEVAARISAETDSDAPGCACDAFAIVGAANARKRDPRYVAYQVREALGAAWSVRFKMDGQTMAVYLIGDGGDVEVRLDVPGFAAPDDACERCCGVVAVHGGICGPCRSETAFGWGPQA